MIRPLLIILLVALSVAPLRAQSPRRVTLDNCLRLAASGSLDVQASQLAVERAQAEQATAFDPDKTAVTLSQDPTSGGSPDNALSVSQTLAFPTVYAARHQLLKQETQLQRAQAELTSQEVGKRVCQAYSTLLYTLQRQRIAQRQAAIYERFRFLAEAKLKYGEAGRLEWMNASRLARESATAAANLDKDVATARLQLQLAVNSDEPLLPADDSLVVLFPQAEVQTETPFAAETFSSLMDLRQSVARQGVKVARQEFLPDITLSASMQLLLRGFNPYHIDRSRFTQGDFMGFEVGLSLPLFYGAQKARLRAAQRGLELAQIEATRQRQQYDARRQAAQTECDKAQANLRLYGSEASAEADEMERISQVAYEKGAIGYVEYIQNLQTAADLRNAQAAAIHAYNLAAIDLLYLMPE